MSLWSNCSIDFLYISLLESEDYLILWAYDWKDDKISYLDWIISFISWSYDGFNYEIYSFYYDEYFALFIDLLSF